MKYGRPASRPGAALFALFSALGCSAGGGGENDEGAGGATGSGGDHAGAGTGGGATGEGGSAGLPDGGLPDAAPAGCKPVVAREPMLGDLIDAGTGGQPGRVATGLDQRPSPGTCLPLPKPTGLSGDSFPQTLAATGCFAPGNLREAVAGPIPYDVNAPLWSDGTVKRRWLVLPAGGKINIGEDGDWDVPNGTMLLKSFEFEGKMLETRFLVRHADGAWAGYTYVFDEGGANLATLQGSAASVRRVGDLRWVFPSRQNCLECHTAPAGHTLGLETGQFNRDFVYANGRRANQLSTLRHIGLFAQDPGDPAALTAYPQPGLASTGSVAQRARAYLHANCAHCHQPGGTMENFFDLRWSTPLAQSSTVGVEPIRGNFGVKGTHLITPGDPDNSMIYLRMHSLVPDIRMPTIGTSRLDSVGLALVKTWIGSLSCSPDQPN